MKVVVMAVTLNLVSDQQVQDLFNVSEFKTTELGINYLLLK